MLPVSSQLKRLIIKPIAGLFPAETAAEASQKPAVWYNMRANAGSSLHVIADRQMGENKKMGEQRAVFFDVDDTLYDHLEPLRQALDRLISPPDGFPYEQVYHRFRHYSDLLSARHGHVNDPANADDLEDMREQRIQLALAEFGIDVDREQAAAIQAAYLEGQFDIRLFPGAQELIRELQERGDVVGVITNGPKEHQMNKVRALGLDKLVGLDRVFVSGAVGMDKPDPRLFRHVNEATGTVPGASWYIGDSWNNDVIGALEAGWTSVWFNHRKVEPFATGHQPHHILGGYGELRSVLLGG